MKKLDAAFKKAKVVKKKKAPKDKNIKL